MAHRVYKFTVYHLLAWAAVFAAMIASVFWGG
jgi:hypothetical protein